MKETKENVPEVPKFMEGEKPTTTEQINYMKLCVEEAEKDLLEVEEQAISEPEFKEHADRMKGLISMLREIQQNLIAVRILEQTGFVQKNLDGIGLIAIERSEQLTKHGRTIESDVKENDKGQLSYAASVLCLQDPADFGEPIEVPEGWDDDKFDVILNKPYQQRLEIAGALIAAEIDRVLVVEKEVNHG